MLLFHIINLHLLVNVTFTFPLATFAPAVFGARFLLSAGFTRLRLLWSSALRTLFLSSTSGPIAAPGSRLLEKVVHIEPFAFAVVITWINRYSSTEPVVLALSMPLRHDGFFLFWWGGSDNVPLRVSLFWVSPSFLFRRLSGSLFDLVLFLLSLCCLSFRSSASTLVLLRRLSGGLLLELTGPRLGLVRLRCLVLRLLRVWGRLLLLLLLLLLLGNQPLLLLLLRLLLVLLLSRELVLGHLIQQRILGQVVLLPVAGLSHQLVLSGVLRGKLLLLLLLLPLIQREVDSTQTSLISAHRIVLRLRHIDRVRGHGLLLLLLLAQLIVKVELVELSQLLQVLIVIETLRLLTLLRLLLLKLL